MRCALDATPLLGPRTGVAAFTAGALTALAARPDVEAFGYALSWRGRSMLREVLPPGVTSGWSVPAGPLIRLWARTDLVSAELIMDLDGGVDVVHGTNFVVPPARRAARVVTVHDLTAVRFPEMVSGTSRRYPQLVRRAAERGAWVHTPSQFVRDEVIELLRVPADRVRAVHHGVDPPRGAGGRGRAIAERLTGRDRYVLAVGTIEPRKDYPTLIAAFDRVAADEADVGLVIAGSRGWGADAVDAAVNASPSRDRIGLTGYVTDEDRADLMCGAAAFAFPSRYEGFGFPPLEAMAGNIPVVATAAGAVPEVCGDSIRTVPVGDPDALAEALLEALRHLDPGRIAAARARADTYTWAACAAGLLDLYEATRAG